MSCNSRVPGGHHFLGVQMGSLSYVRQYANSCAPKVCIPRSVGRLPSEVDFTAMYALGIPTTRSLSLISLPSLPVVRERIESACVLTRLAPSFIRIGSFEALNPPEQIFFLGGGQQDPDWDALRILGEWVARRVLKLADVNWKEGEAWGKALVVEVAKRNARMVAGWQAYGFMHGVINTDK